MMKFAAAGIMIFLLFVSLQIAESADETPGAVQNKPEDQLSDLDRGIRLNRLNSREADGYLKRALASEPADPQTNLELGIFYYNRQIFAEASDYFESARELAPGSEYARKAGEYLGKMQAGKELKRWSLGISVGEQYDSNVTIIGNNSPLPEGITRKSDWKNLVYLNGRVTLIKTDKAEASAGYSLYQTLHYRLSDFNITQNLADLSYAYNLSPAVRIGAAYRFEYILVGGKDYDAGHSIGPSVTISEGKGFSTEVQYRYKYTRFKNDTLFTTNSDRTGQNSLFGIVQTVPVGDAVRGEIGYAYDRDLAREDFWKYDGNKGFASLNIMLPARFFVNVYGEYYAKDYDGITPGAGKARKDKTGTFSVSATRFFSDAVGVSLSETFINNRSNIDDFQYKRYLTSLLVHVRF